MFGGQQSNNTPFGGGGFGQQQNTAPAFGAPAPAPGMSLFGAPAPVAPFGQQQQQQQTTFGGGGFGGGGFGSAPTPAPSLFGAPAPAPATGFGFGSSAAAPAPSAFAPATGTGLFGQQQNTAPAFGAPAPAPGLGLFGSAAPAPTAPSFGTFGGSTTTTTSAFGSSAGGFGAPAPAMSSGLFGSTPAPAPTPAFGSPPAFGGIGGGGSTFPATGGGLFGSTTSAALSPAQSSFFGGGASTVAPGQPTGQGGTRAIPYTVTSRHDGTQSINVQSITAMPAYENKSFEELRFEDYSQGNRGSASTPTASGGSGGGFFGSPAPSGNLFGSAPAPAPLFGSAPAPVSGGLFGQAPAPVSAFGSNTGSTFGGGGFGTQQAPAPATGNLFGSTAPAPFGAPTGGSSSLFGNPPSTGGFGGNPATSSNLFGGSAPANTTGFGFGSAPAPAAFGAAPSPGGGLFNNPPTTFGGSSGGFGFGSSPAPAFSSSPGTSLFGQQPAPAPSTGFAFGSPSPGTNLFGQQPAPAPGAFSFSGQPAPAQSSFFGGSAPAPLGGLFGAQPQAGALGASPYGASLTPGGGGAQFSFPQNAAIVPPSTNEMMAQQLRALEKATEEFKKQEVWQSNSYIGKSTSSTPTSVSEAESLLNYNSSRLSPLYSSPPSFMSPQSAAKIRPRGVGFPKTEPSKKSGGGGATVNQPMLSRMGRSSSGGYHGTATPSSARSAMSLAPPDSYFPSPTLQLVVRPNSLAKPMSLSAVQFRLDMDSPSASGTTTETDSPPYTTETINSPPPDETRRTDSHQESSSSHSRTSPLVREQTAATADISSPANSYYQQTIGATDNGYASDRKRSTSSSSSVPKLTKAGYETSPSLDDLAAMSDADLAAVPNFAVIRPNYGSVQWEGAVDVRGTNLDRVVVIEAKDVSVYSVEEREGTKPAVGTKLNRPAILTYYQVFPKDNPASSAAEKEKFAAKLEKSARRMEADFVSYDMESGDWKIRVHHFSRYALVDEDDNSQASEADVAVGAGSSQPTEATSAGKKSSVRFEDVATPQRPSSSSSILRRKATPYKPPPSRTQFSVSESNTEDDDEIMETTEYSAHHFSEADIMDAVGAKAQAAFNDIFSMVKQHDSKQQSRSFATITKPRARTVAIEDEDDYLDDDSAGKIEIYPPTALDILQARQRKGISGILAQRAGVGKAGVDLSLRMGRSFRVAASPNGFFIMPGSHGDGLQKICPVFNKDPNIVDKTDDLLNTHLGCCQMEYTHGSKCPLFRLPQAVQEMSRLYDTLIEFESTDCGNKDAQVAFGLIACLLESAVLENAGSNSLAVHGSSNGDEFSACQNTAVLRWLVEVCAAEVDQDISTALRRNDVPSAIFSAISGGDIGKACDVAADAGYFGLATVLATDVEGRRDIVRLLARLDETGDVAGVPSELLRSLNHIAGDSRFEDAPFRQGRSNLNWQRRLALQLIQEPKEDLNQIIQRYELDVKSGAAPFPSPPFSRSVSVGASKNGVESIHFRIMRAMTKPGCMKLSEIVSPEGFTQSIHDSSMAFHFSAILAAAGSKSSDDIEIMLADFESQLVSQGRWEWAVFVTLCLIGDISENEKRRKLKRAKDFLLTHFWSGDPEVDYRREFLETNLQIPSKWFSEAIAGRAVALSEFILNELDVNLDSARATFEKHSLPYLFFMSPTEIEKLMKFIEDCASGNSDSLTGAVYDFFRLKDRIDQLNEDKNQNEIDRVLPELEVLHQKVDTIIRSRQRQVQALVGGDGETRCFVGFPEQRMDLSNMLSEALHHLGQLRLQIMSLRSTQKEQAPDSNMLVMMEE